jgi:hypothetical protein
MPGYGKQLTQPIFPRPVSPLHYEPLYTRPEDILWDQDSTEERNDNDEGTRAAKKRRIEKAGEAYLRGEPLFILSASIRGPLGEGWVNPWSRHKRRVGDLGAESLRGPRKVEIPETAERGGKDKTQRRHERNNVILQKDNLVRPSKQVEIFRRSRVHQDPFILDTARLEDRKTPKAPNSQGWLKKDSTPLNVNGDFYTEDDQQYGDPSSPIKQPGPARRNTLLQAEQGQGLSSETSDAAFDGRAETLIEILRKRGNAVKSPISARRQEVTHAQKLPSASQGDDSHSAKQPQSPPDSIPKDAAETPTEKQIHSPAAEIAEQRLPSPPSEGSSVGQESPQSKTPILIETCSSIALANDQPKSFRDAAKHFPINQQHVDSKQQDEKLDPPESADSHPSVPPPTLSTDTSSATVVGVMPSAQAVQAPPLNESLPCTGDKLSEQHQDQIQEEEDRAFYLSTQAAITTTHLQLQNEVITPQAPTASSSIDSNMKSTSKPKSKSGITLFSAFNKRQPNSIFTTTHGSPNTQDMLNAVTPFDLATTVKRVPLTTIPPNSESPTFAAHQAVKKRATKIKKKASFAPPLADSTAISSSGSSQGSIKTSLKVSKTGIRTTPIGVPGKPEQGIRNMTTDDPSFPAFNHPALDMETSPEADIESSAGAAASGQNMPGTAASSKPATVTITTHSSKSTSTKQDAQMLPPSSFLYHRAYVDEDSVKRLPDHHGGATNGIGVRKGMEYGSVGGGRRVHPTDRVGGGLEAERRDAAENEHDHEYDNGNGDGNGNGNENALSFDLSAAMDEVGSFLLSWDTEREVREMEREEVVVRKIGGVDGVVDGMAEQEEEEEEGRSGR